MLTVKRKLIILLCVLVLFSGLFLLGGAALILRRPAMPSAWQLLRLGMARSEVLSIVGSDTPDARGIKGFESTGMDVSMAAMPSNWSIFLCYDTSERLISADARFINRVTGLLSTEEFSVFP